MFHVFLNACHGAKQKARTSRKEHLAAWWNLVGGVPHYVRHMARAMCEIVINLGSVKTIARAGTSKKFRVSSELECPVLEDFGVHLGFAMLSQFCQLPICQETEVLKGDILKGELLDPDKCKEDKISELHNGIDQDWGCFDTRM